MSVLLKGITWSHSRGYTSITAVSQRFSELNPGVSIEWEKRSLQEFADAPIENLAKAYISSQMADAIVFAVLIIVLLVKPTGILGKKISEKV